MRKRRRQGKLPVPIIRRPLPEMRLRTKRRPVLRRRMLPILREMLRKVRGIRSITELRPVLVKRRMRPRIIRRILIMRRLVREASALTSPES